MLKAHIDFEGGAPGDLKKQGLHRWLEHPANQCWCMSWRLGSFGPVNRWHPGDPDPAALLEHVRSGGIVVAHNAAFERWYWNLIIRRKYAPHWPALRIEQQDCTVAKASALGLPAGLDDLGHVLGTVHQKDKDGAALMMKMARPRTRSPCFMCAGDGCEFCDGCGELFTWWNTSENIARLGDYCDDDVRAETDLDDKETPLSAREHRVWMLDQVINDRGVMLDMPLVRRAHAIVDYAKLQLDVQIKALTGKAVEKATQVARIKAWIEAQGIPCLTLAKGNQDELIALADLFDAPQVEEAITIRRQAARSSTAKLKQMELCVGADDRARGQLFYHATTQGRKAGRLIQLQNLYRTDPDADGNAINLAIEIMQSPVTVQEAHDRLETVLGEPMTMIAKCLRSTIIAGPGNHLVYGDLSNVEGCGNAWVSGEEWKIEAYLAYQAGRGPDLYRLSYGRSFGVDFSVVTGPQRQIGKVQELACGYQGSVGAYYSMSQTYLMKLAPIAHIIRDTVDPGVWSKACWLYSRMPAPKRHGLSMEIWAALKIVVDNFREANPMITQSWWDLQDAAIEAMANPTVIVPCLGGKIKYMTNKGFLWCQLPSGRLIAYPKARLVWKDDSTLTLIDGTVVEAALYGQDEINTLVGEGAEYNRKIKRQVIYEGFADDAHVWIKKALYGGRQSAHVVSGIARDILVDCSEDLEALGYPIVLDIHDELITEPPIGHGSAAEMQAVMARPRAWCPGFPLAAKAWEGPRYAK